ncbi:integrase arm-type DNA-binding domain-containing protein [uncultured Thiothrix sp.]|uniref:tyrosine-type recombinase/integrase n=1 Tax=uncultured Thiothrix sp. TaxID=223185 RepID=UPI00260DA1C6|nr:integrase arm-type DNA-binding domain-containing protein [uncultured Thiothrix sp.]HMT94621.1 integrase arm-type DNA-binding domain-containing protein [Thiolinea sp.]
MKYKLTDTAIKAAKTKPDGKPAKHTDGGGLYLFVMQSGKYWRYDYTHEAKRKTLALGVYPDINLKTAREKHQEARELLARGIDPSEYKQQAKAEQIAITENTFEAIALEWLVKMKPTWKSDHADKLMSRFVNDVFPWLGNQPIATIEPPDILKCLRRVEERGAVETAHRIKQTIGQVFRYAVGTGRAQRDQTTDLKGALPAYRGKSFSAIIEPLQVGQLMRDIQGYAGHLETRIALQLSAYLFQRPNEICAMEWAEIDVDKAVWSIPANKMKMGQAHLVPLPKQCLDLLAEIKPLTGHRRYVFPSMTDSTKPMSNNTVRQALRRMGYDNATMTAHGFRAMARTLLDEALEVNPIYIEQQLAHAVKDANGTAYNRTKHLKQRIAMMQQWADYLDTLRAGAQVIPFKAKAG